MNAQTDEKQLKDNRKATHYANCVTPILIKHFISTFCLERFIQLEVKLDSVLRRTYPTCWVLVVPITQFSKKLAP